MLPNLFTLLLIDESVVKAEIAKLSARQINVLIAKLRLLMADNKPIAEYQQLLELLTSC